MEEYRGILESDIQILAYGDLRYSIFAGEDVNRQEYQVRIECVQDGFEVYTTRDRASVTGKYSFENFEDARNKFIRLLKLMVLSNQEAVKEGERPVYSSPLWDK
ncbi:hypothetical protein HCJ57_03670 [Listeria booriae]|uniref:Imm59 family immunity protein n=1 Tax=Listeria booriae TaxID=1552123 RepID=UPI00162A2893|nr:Imm59 family immunity protein [Listeria booriae]MBC1912773.1 hypothetical protein [Listeria booriae]MBC1975090.1 hypothetical protein [Listeria booriae]MBC2032382.1 hypothetical protein [Listeria booriae]MBC2055584.1 hypothetical protein [Listeria booriae]